MRKTLTVSLVAALGVVLASAAFGYTGTYTPGNGINGTPHDLSKPVNGMDSFIASPADSKTRICIFCHAPHNAYKLSTANGGPGALGAGPTAPDAFDYLPLWNHTLPTAAAYSMYYAGPGAPATGAKAQQSLGAVPGSTSLLCLSCHDGSVAVNSYGNGSQPVSSQSTGTATIGSGYVIGQNGVLQNHHPIGFSYGAVWAVDSGIRDASITQLGTAGTISSHLYASAAVGASDTMECGTCHSVHNTGNSGESLLWRSDANSALCLTCHAKGTAP